MPKPTTIHRQIEGVDYCFTHRNNDWQVTRNGKRTDRFYRTYRVQCDPNGKPLRCSCPAVVYAGNWCRHLRAIEAILEEQTMAKRKKAKVATDANGFQYTQLIGEGVKPEDVVDQGILVKAADHELMEKPTQQVPSDPTPAPSAVESGTKEPATVTEGLQVFSTKDRGISFDKTRLLFTAMASTFDWRGKVWPKSFLLVSVKTGEKKEFTRHNVNSVADLVWVDYQCEMMTFRVFND